VTAADTVAVVRRRTPAARTIVLVLLAGLVVGVLTPPRRLADASTYVLMTDSLWVDGDLTYSPGDLARAQAMQFADLPNGLFLIRHSWGYSYGKALLYPLVALPFYALFGVRGFFALNGVLLAALVLICADILAHRLERGHALIAAAVVIGFTVTPAYLHWIDPFLLCSVLVAGLLAAYRRERPALAGVLLALLAGSRLPYVTLGFAPAALYMAERRWRSLGRFAVGGIVATALILGAQRAGSGEWEAHGGDRRVYMSAFPYQLGPDEPDLGRDSRISVDTFKWLSPAELIRNNAYFFAGRFAGVVVYFPTLLACLVWIRRWDREKAMWSLALLATCEGIIVSVPHNIFGGNQALGNRLFVLLPVALVWVDFVAWQWWRVGLTAALLALAVPVVEAPVYLSVQPGQQMVEIPYRYFPFEWTQALQVTYPFHLPGLGALTPNQYYWEGDGVWTRGGTTAEFVIIRVVGDPPQVRLWSFLDGATVLDGSVPAAVRWQPRTDMEVPLSHPIVEYYDDQSAKALAVYRLTITTESATAVPTVGARDDNRMVGVFVRPQRAGEDPHRQWPQ
jgi:hypothetical protein